MTEAAELVVAERDQPAVHDGCREAQLSADILALLVEFDEVLEAEIDILPTSSLSYEETHIAAAALARRQVHGAKQICF